MINWECRQCHERLEAPESLQGQVLDCPRCGCGGTVPAAQTQSAPVCNTQGTDDPDESERQIGDYKLWSKGRLLHIDGPDDTIAKDIAHKYLAALPTEELMDIVLSGESELILGEALGGWYDWVKGEATAELERAKSLGLPYPENPTWAYTRRMLDQCEEIRFYVCFVWEQIIGKTPPEAGIPSEMIDRFVVHRMRADECLCARILLLQHWAHLEDRNPSMESSLFRDVSAELTADLGSFMGTGLR